MKFPVHHVTWAKDCDTGTPCAGVDEQADEKQISVLPLFLKGEQEL
jgi:hypothetical protein